jgi:hypothetical protein
MRSDTPLLFLDTEDQPTEIQPTEIQPTEIQPTEIQARKDRIPRG